MAAIARKKIVPNTFTAGCTGSEKRLIGIYRKKAEAERRRINSHQSILVG